MTKNLDYGLPEVSEDSAKIINYIFRRLSGSIPAMKYSADSVARIDSIRAEYTYAIVRHQITEMEIINRAIEFIVDDAHKFLPPPGAFIEYCLEAKRERARKAHREEYERERKERLIDEYFESEAIRILAAQGVHQPKVKVLSPDFEKYMRPWWDSVNALKDQIRSEAQNG